MPHLETQTAKINAVISLKGFTYETIKNDIFVSLTNWCEANCKMYAYILHDKDVLDSGEVKTPHIHLVCQLNSSRCRLSTTLNNISEVLGINGMSISIEKANDFNGSIQYLVHKNNIDKFQYNLLDICTNLPKGELDVYMSSEGGSVSIESLVSIVKKNKSLIDIIRDVGLQNYRVYRNVIMDIYSEIHYGT